MKQKAAVVGFPIAHSLSPAIHGYWLKKYGIDGVYDARAVELGTFPKSIARLRKEGLRGVNVTVPYKEEAFALATIKDETARAAGAANLLIFGERDIEARNTDVFGLAASLEEKLGAGALKGKSATLLGTGGAARGALLALSNLGVGDIRVVYRTRANAERMKDDFKRATKISLTSWDEGVANTALIVNTTSAGMKGNAPLDVSFAPVPKDAAICDIVYNPLMTDFLKLAAAHGNITIDGLGMLMHQAAPSFEAYFGVKTEVTKE
jgi:shikimate dehydrogenase